MVPHHLITLIVHVLNKCLKMTKFIKNNLRIIFKLHAHHQTMTKTSVKFQKNRHLNVGGVRHTKHTLSIYFDL